MIPYKETNEQIRGFKDRSSKVELVSNYLSRQILLKHGYNPYAPVNFSNRFKEIFDHSTDYGIDDYIFIKDIPANDPLGFKKVKPFNNDNTYYSIDYKSHQFRDNEVNLMLMKIRHSNFYTMKTFFKRCEKGKADQYKLQGLLSNEKQTDFFFLTKRADPRYNPDNEPDSLISSYIIPALSLKQLILDNLNLVRESRDLEPIRFEDTNVNKLFGIYETWKIYNEIDSKIKKDYPFELFKQIDRRPSQKNSLMIKIPKEHLTNYILIGKDGEIIEHRS